MPSSSAGGAAALMCREHGGNEGIVPSSRAGSPRSQVVPWEPARAQEAWNSIALRAKERTQQFSGFLGHQSGMHFALMIQMRTAHDIQHAAGRS